MTSIAYLEVCGFRSYGAEPQRVELSTSLTVIHADNSQGKTSLAEAFEFLHAGTISRRQLGGGSPGEFDGALRNAHLSPTADVYVEAGLTVVDGREMVIRRRLDTDYSGAADCTSTLTVNGTVVDSVVEAGLQLADPPLAAPVLLEHALRYAVSAKPGERSDYFKAVLEVADLDIVRAEIAALINEREARPRERLVQKLDSLAQIRALPALRTISAAASEPQLTHKLLEALNALVPPAPEEAAGEQSLLSAVERVQHELAVRQDRVVPIHELQPGRGLLPGRQVSVQIGAGHRDAATDGVTLGDQLADYNAKAATVERSIADVLPLLRAALSVGVVAEHSGESDVDCPLCLTPGALTTDRLAAIRHQVADQEGLSQAGTTVRQTVLSLHTELEALKTWSTGTRPPATSWTDAQRDAHSRTIIELGGSSEHFGTAVDAAQMVHSSAGRLSSVIDTASGVLAEIIHQLDHLAAVPDVIITQLIQSEALIGQLVSDHMIQIEYAAQASGVCIEDVAPKLSSLSDTEGWPVVVELSTDAPELWQAIMRQKSAEACTARLKAAQRAVIKATKDILDDKLRLMADEIRKWWSLMRPDELTVFDRISRRGAGNRYLDLTAALVPEPAGSGVIRNALAVLSNSQLNALGLAAFLARCELLESPVVFLDDPVPGSDREHRYTFARSVISELLQAGRQIVVATHDAELARMLQTLHQHLGIAEHSATLLDPRMGTRIVRTGDDFERLMLDASSQMNSPLLENRRAAGNSLRIATERLAKHILVAERVAAGELDASIADYDNKNLKDLRPLVIAVSKAPNEPGLWAMLARILNDADHDTSPPLPADLKMCHDTLRDIKKRHKVSTPADAA